MLAQQSMCLYNFQVLKIMDSPPTPFSLKVTDLSELVKFNFEFKFWASQGSLQRHATWQLDNLSQGKEQIEF